MKISKKKIKTDVWCKYGKKKESPEFLIRRVPLSDIKRQDVRLDENNRPIFTVSMEDEWDSFNKMLVGWKNLDDEDTGGVFEFNEENKHFIFDHIKVFKIFIVSSAAKLDADLEKELKNLKK